MTTGLVVGNVVQAKVACYQLNQVAENVAAFRVVSGTGLGATDQQVASALDALLAPLYKAALANTATYFGVQVRIANILPRPVPAVSAAHTGVGTGGAAPLPAQDSGLIAFETAFAGPAYRGRAYIPFPPAVANDAPTNEPTAAYQVLLDSIGNALTTPFTVGIAPDQSTLRMVIFHRIPNSSTDVTFPLTRTRWATQRRRGGYGRANAIPPF